MTDHQPMLHLADAGAVETLLDELAAAIRPHLQTTTALVGILRRGAPLAHLLAQRLAGAGQRPPEVGELALKRYSDDLAVLHDRPHLDEDSLNIAVDGRHLVLVDDVLFTGRTVRAALDALVRAGRPRSIQLLVLVDRGHREYPIQPDYVGRVLPTKHEETVDVVELEDGLAVDVVE